jgi:integrase
MSVYKRGGVWWVKIRHRGTVVRRSARTPTRRIAQQYERQIREELGRLDRGGRPRRSFEDAMLRFLDEHEVKPATRRRYEVSARAMLAPFGHKHLDEINRSAIMEFIAARRKAASADTVRNDLACLSAMFNRAIDWEWVEANPVQKLRRHVGRSRRRTRYLTRDEEDRLLAAAGEYLRPMIAFAIDTGLRLEEQLSLTWDQVSAARRELSIPKTKTDLPRVVPLLDRAGHILGYIGQVRRLDTQHVFIKGDGTRYGKLTRGLAGAARRAGIADLKWHDLRRTCGCRLLQDHGLDIKRVSNWLGHSSVVVTERSYAFLRAEDLHRALSDGAQKRAQSTRTYRGGDSEEGS